MMAYEDFGRFVEPAALFLDIAELLEGFWNWRERREPCRPSVARAR